MWAAGADPGLWLFSWPGTGGSVAQSCAGPAWCLNPATDLGKSLGFFFYLLVEQGVGRVKSNLCHLKRVIFSVFGDRKQKHLLLEE